MSRDNVVLEKSMNFAIRIVKLHGILKERKCEFKIAEQLLKSGTSIGANINEAVQGQSRGDFVSKMNIALKEAFETDYWLELFHRTSYLTKEEYESIISDCIELKKILISIVKTTKEKI